MKFAISAIALSLLASLIECSSCQESWSPTKSYSFQDPMPTTLCKGVICTESTQCASQECKDAPTKEHINAWIASGFQEGFPYGTCTAPPLSTTVIALIIVGLVLVLAGGITTYICIRKKRALR